MIYKFNNFGYDLNSRTYIMGILNITPDSFSDGGKYFKSSRPDIRQIINDAVRMEREGADFIDIGGESTRPEAEKISIELELERVIPAINSIKKKIRISVG